MGTHIWNHLNLLLRDDRHVIQTIHKCKEAGPIAVLHTDVGGEPTRDTTPLEQVGTTLHLVRVMPNQMQTLQRAGTYHVPFLQQPDWPDKSLLEEPPATGGRHGRSPTTL